MPSMILYTKVEQFEKIVAVYLTWQDSLHNPAVKDGS
jgi:hypothetical protein